MGMQDRDYYRDWWRKKTGHVEKATFRVPFPNGEDDGGAYLRGVESPRVESWHPILSFLLFVVICFGTFFLLRLISKLSL